MGQKECVSVMGMCVPLHAWKQNSILFCHLEMKMIIGDDDEGDGVDRGSGGFFCWWWCGGWDSSLLLTGCV